MVPERLGHPPSRGRRGSSKGRTRTTIDWLADFIPAPVAIVDRGGRVRHCNHALQRSLSEETDRGRRQLRDALRRLASQMLADEPTDPDSVRSKVLSLRTPCRRYGLEPLMAPKGEIRGLIRIHRSRVIQEPGSLAERFGLTAREAQVAQLVAAGATNKSIASKLELSQHTVRRHTESIFRKAGVSSRAALSALWYGSNAN